MAYLSDVREAILWWWANVRGGGVVAAKQGKCLSCGAEPIPWGIAACPSCGKTLTWPGQTVMKKCHRCKQLASVPAIGQSWCPKCGYELTNVAPLSKGAAVGESVGLLGKAITQLTCGIIMLIVLGLIFWACATAH